MAISDEQIEEIRAKIDIADLISSYGFNLKHSGSDLWCCCPFHTEKTPSFKVDSIKGTYHCFGCGESGDIFSFVQKQEGLSFIETVQKLAEIANIELHTTKSGLDSQRQRLYELMANLALAFNKMLWAANNNDGQTAREYLQKRQINKEVANRFLIGYAPKEVDKILAWAGRHGYSYQDLAAAGLIKVSDSANKRPYFYFANRLVFAIKNKNGQVVAFSGRQLVEDKKSGKYINSPETLIFKKSKTFFAFEEARKHIVKAPNREAIICEGQIDCIRLHMSGYKTAIAPLGTAFTEEHAIMLHRVADSALLCFDDDGAGHKATIRAAKILLAEGMTIRVISLPDGEDPDSFILKYGGDAFGNLIKDRAESIVRFQKRVEQLKETTPNDPNAMVRVVKAILSTIAQSKDRVLRNVLLKEAAQVLDMEYATLVEDIAKDSEKPQEKHLAEDQLIEPNEENAKIGVDNLPSTAEGALISFLYANENNSELKTIFSQLMPLAILKSPMAQKLCRAWLDGNTTCPDAIQQVIDSLSPLEYQTFLSIIINYDSTQEINLPLKTKIVYFARHFWYLFMVELLTKTNKMEDEKFLAETIKSLQKATVKGFVHLILTFPYDRFAITPNI